MEWDILKEKSIINVMNKLSDHLTHKSHLSASENIARKKCFFRTSYEILLNKRLLYVTDTRTDYALGSLTNEAMYLMLSQNKKHMTKDIRNKIITMTDKLSETARRDEETLHLVKSLIKVILMLNDNLPPNRKRKGILKYKEPDYFPSLSIRHEFLGYISSSENHPYSFMRLNKSTSDFQLFPVKKLKKSATWHDAVVDSLSNISRSPSFSQSRPVSQTFSSQDEGFVTPDDNHREITPEPFKDSKRRQGNYQFTWEVCSEAPCEYKNFETQWSPEEFTHASVKDRNINVDIESCYNAMRAEFILKELPAPESLQHFITPEQLASDIVTLIYGLPSSTFQLLQDGFKLVSGTYTTGVMPEQLSKLASPFIKLAELYLNVETYINRMKSYDSIVSQAFYESINRYLYYMKSLLLCDLENMSSQQLIVKLDRLATKPLANIEFLWNIMNCEGVVSCHQVIEKLYLALSYIHDDSLLSLVNIILLKCCYVYIKFFEKYISTGVCAEELLCEATGSLSVEKVPYFLRSLADVINNSSKTLKIIHKDPKMVMLKLQIASEKPDIPKKIYIDPQEAMKQHYLKFMKEKEEERAKLAKKKSEQMEAIKEDIAAKQKWKELEAAQLEIAELKREDRYQQLDAIKQQYIDDCKKEVTNKYDTMIRESERKIAVANWKLNRLANHEKRTDLIKNEESENRIVRDDLMNQGIDISEENKDLMKSPLKVELVEIKPKHIEVLEVEEVYNRHEEASEIKRKIMESTDTFKYDDVDSNSYKKVVKTNDYDSAKIFEENRNKALATKKKVMSSEFDINNVVYLSPEKYTGLSETDRKQIEDDLMDFPPPDPNEKDEYLELSLNFNKAKDKVEDIVKVENFGNKLHSGLLNSVEFQHMFLKSAEAYLKKELEVTNKVLLQYIRDDYVKEVRWILDYYLLQNDIWASGMIKKLITLIHRGSINLITLNRLFPHPLALRGSNPPAILDPTDPKTIDFLVLTYKPREPLHHFINDRIILKYNANFLYVVKIQLAVHRLWNCRMFLRNHQSNQGVQYDLIHYHIHVMNHFSLSMKSFLGNSLEKCWNKFLAEAGHAKSLDALHSKSIKLLKYSQYFCMQNRRSTRILELILRLLQHVYKYCETLLSGVLSLNKDGELVHSLYSTLAKHFDDFLTKVRSIYSVFVRLSESGTGGEYFSELFELLSANRFYAST